MNVMQHKHHILNQVINKQIAQQQELPPGMVTKASTGMQQQQNIATTDSNYSATQPKLQQKWQHQQQHNNHGNHQS